MLTAILKTFNQFFEPAFWRVLLKSLLISGVLLGLCLWAGMEMVGAVPQTGYGWIDWIIEKISPIGAFLMAFILYPALASVVMGLFLDEIALAVETRHYPNDPPGVPVGVRTSFMSALKLGLTMLVVNLLALPLYILFLFFPILSLALFYLINGYLLNKEYFELIVQRHGDDALLKSLRKKHGGRLFLGGCAIAFLFTLPFLNLTAPLLATGLMVHIFKDINQHSGQ
jgi:CysZ protein